MSQDFKPVYTVSEIAKMFGKSTRTIYRAIEEMKKLNIKGYDIVSQDMSQDMSQANSRFNQATIINSVGYDFICDYLNVTPKVNDNDNELLSSLYSQLSQKDSYIEMLTNQLKEKDKQIDSLLKQAENFQILMSHSMLPPVSDNIVVDDEQPPKKKHWWQK